MTARIPSANADRLFGLARRTRRTWLALAVTLAVLTAVGLVLTLTGRTADSGVLPSGGDTVVVLDLSGSTRATLKRVANVLLRLTRDGKRQVGLVVFSDTGYEALPLAAPAGALRSWLTLVADQPRSSYPWSLSFSGGTVISSGLSIALRMLERRPIGDRHVLLVSDLVDGVVDLPRLQSLVAAYQRERIDLRVVTITGGSGTGGQAPPSFLQLPNAAFVKQAADQVTDSSSVTAIAPGFPWALVGVVLLIAIAAATYEAILQPLSWRRV